MSTVVDLTSNPLLAGVVAALIGSIITGGISLLTTKALLNHARQTQEAERQEKEELKAMLREKEKIEALEKTEKAEKRKKQIEPKFSIKNINHTLKQKQQNRYSEFAVELYNSGGALKNAKIKPSCASTSIEHPLLRTLTTTKLTVTIGGGWTIIQPHSENNRL